MYLRQLWCGGPNDMLDGFLNKISKIKYFLIITLGNYYQTWFFWEKYVQNMVVIPSLSHTHNSNYLVRWLAPRSRTRSLRNLKLNKDRTFIYGHSLINMKSSVQAWMISQKYNNLRRAEYIDHCKEIFKLNKETTISSFIMYIQ